MAWDGGGGGGREQDEFDGGEWSEGEEGERGKEGGKGRGRGQEGKEKQGEGSAGGMKDGKGKGQREVCHPARPSDPESWRWGKCSVQWQVGEQMWPRHSVPDVGLPVRCVPVHSQELRC